MSIVGHLPSGSVATLGHPANKFNPDQGTRSQHAASKSSHAAIQDYVCHSQDPAQ